jgi:subtilisin family serine protease
MTGCSHRQTAAPTSRSRRPGVDILLAAPNGSYQMQSGTSFAAAQVSGIAALLLERNPALDAASIRRILISTARDLGPPGHDEQFGSGLA